MNSISFVDYCYDYINCAEVTKKTRSNYLHLMGRIQDFLDGIPLVELTREDLEEFYIELRSVRRKAGGRKMKASHLAEQFEQSGLSMKKLAKLSGTAFETIQRALKGDEISEVTATKISMALDKPIDSLFVVTAEAQVLSEETVMHYHRLISTVLEDAVENDLVNGNVAKHMASGHRYIKKGERDIESDV